jgi:hypothetical protein
LVYVQPQEHHSCDDEQHRVNQADYDVPLASLLVSERGVTQHAILPVSKGHMLLFAD